MFPNLTRFSLILLALVIPGAVLAYSPLSGFNGARPLSLGNAYVAQADDAYSFYINPAGLTELKLFNMFSTYSQLDSNTTFSGIGGVLPDLFGLAVGLGYRRLSLTGLQASAEMIDFADQETAISIGKRIGEGLSLGAALRFITRGTTQNVPGYNGANGSGLAFDLSIKRIYRSWLRLGVSAQDLGGRINYQDGTSVNLPYDLILGSSLDILGPKALIEKPGRLTANLDLSENNGNPLLMHAGLEWQPVGLIALRAGLEQSFAEIQDPFARGVIYNNLTAGLGFRYGGIALDYAMHRNGDPSGDVINYLSFSFEYSEPTEEAGPSIAQEEITPAGTVEAAIRTVKIKHFPDVPKAYWGREAIEMLATAGIMWGYTDGYFHPNNKVSLGEFSTIISVAKHITPVSVPNEEKLMTRQEAARQLKLGTRPDRPRRPVTRAELAKMIFQTDWAQAAIKRLPTLEE